MKMTTLQKCIGAIAVIGLLATGNLRAQQEASGRELHTHAYCRDFPLGPGLQAGEKGFVDRFNYPWHPSAQLVEAGKKRGASVKGIQCGGFTVDFEDVILSTGAGFDDQTPVVHPVLGNTTLGEVRQRTACEVFSYIGSLMDIQGAPDVVFRQSLNGNGGFLAAASPLFMNTAGPGFIGGTMYDHITTGINPTPNAGDYDAFIIVDFGYNYNSDWNAPAGARFDLFSVLLHEATHTLGFLSLIGANGASKVGGAYALYDKRVYNTALTPLVDPVSATFVGSVSSITSNGLVFEGERCSSGSPIYSPALYQSGSSGSHFDYYRSGIRYVMRPSTSGGEDREYTEQELQVLCDLGYTMKGGVCGNCAPYGRQDFGTTDQGVIICLNVLANDTDPDGDPVSIDPASLRIDAGGGNLAIVGTELCYTPAPDFYGVARIVYRPTDGNRAGNETLVLITVNGPPILLSDRRDGDIWYFGRNAGMAFNGGASPVPLLDGMANTLEGTAVANDPVTGDLLFYTNGQTVWNAQHTIMPNGQNLKGHWTSAQSAMIVPDPGDPLQFYIFTTGAGGYHTSDPNNNGYWYSKVDMRLNNGHGDVTVKNVQLIVHGTEKQTATRHCNGIDYWVITHEWGSDQFYAYLVTASGVSAPVKSAVGEVTPRDPSDTVRTGQFAQGCAKISPDGKHLAVGSTYLHNVELFDFNNKTGQVTAPRLLKYDPQHLFYGPSFSPDNSKLYITTLGDPSLPYSVVFQFDLEAGDDDAIRNSMTEIHRVKATWPGAQIQLGPDSKIYISEIGRGSLAVITRPNEKGLACDYVHNGFDLAGRTTSVSLPNFIDSDLNGVETGIARPRISVQVNDKKPGYGDVLEYTIEICNNSDVDLSNIDISDVLPKGLEYVSGFSSYPRHRFASIMAGECVSVVLQVRVTGDIGYGVPITNCVAILDEIPASVDNCVVPDQNCATFSISGTDLAVLKTVDKERPEPGERITYTVTVANQGPIDATNVVVNDVLPAGVLYVSHASVGPPANYNPATGELTIPALLVGEAVILTVECDVSAMLVGRAVNCAELVSLDQTDLDPTNNKACATISTGMCDGVEVRAMAHIGEYFVDKTDVPQTTPIMLDEPLDAELVTRLRISFQYKTGLMLLEHGDEPEKMLERTLLEDWTVLAYDNGTPGRYVLELAAPAPNKPLMGTGVLLNVMYRVYLSDENETALPFSIEFPENECIDVDEQSGYLELLICGLNSRLIESYGKYSLSQATPNPFNPATRLQFSLGLDGPTTLCIYDARGREIARLVDEYLPTGTYNVQWDATGFASGLYYYRIQSGNWVRINSMVLLK